MGSMETAFIIIWVVCLIVYVRASLLAWGGAKSKLFKNEGFLFWQKIIAIICALSALGTFVFGLSIFGYVFLANFIINALFYLQPTPRTTKKLFYAFVLMNLIFLGDLILTLT